MPEKRTETLTLGPFDNWVEVERYGNVDFKSPDQYRVHAQQLGGARHSHVSLKLSLNLLNKIVEHNPNIEKIESIKITGLRIQGWEVWENVTTGFSITNNYTITVNATSESCGIERIHGTDKGNKWKVNQASCDLEVPVDDPRVTLERVIDADIGWSTGYIGVGSRYAIFTIVYTYIGKAPPPGEITVIVLSPKKAPIMGARCYLYTGDNKFVDSKYTDVHGIAKFIVPRGTYVLKVLPPIFKPWYLPAEAVVETSQTYEVVLPSIGIDVIMPYITTAGILIGTGLFAYYGVKTGFFEKAFRAATKAISTSVERVKRKKVKETTL